MGGERVAYLTLEPERNSPTLLLIHGAGMNARGWVEQLRGLGTAARVLALDLPGHGDSAADGAPSLARYAEVVAGFADAVVDRPVIAVGHSLGGAVALAFAAGWSAAVRGLVLLSSCARLPPTESPWQWLAPLLPWPLRRLVFLFTARHMLFAPRASGRAVSFGMREVQACRPQTIAQDVAVARAMDVTELARALAVPTLILCGRRDRITPPALSETLHALIGPSRLGLVEGAGHMLPLEAPAVVNDEITRFVESLPDEYLPVVASRASRRRLVSRLRLILKQVRTLWPRD